MCEGKAGLLHQRIPSIQSRRGLCLELNQADVNTVKPNGSKTTVTTSQDMLLPLAPSLGDTGKGAFGIWQHEAGLLPCKKGKEPNQAHMGWVKLCCAAPGMGMKCWEIPPLLLLQKKRQLCH